MMTKTNVTKNDKNRLISENVRDNKGRRVGVLVAVEREADGVVTIGWSRCMKGDQFDHAEGAEFALKNMGKSYPPSFEKAIQKFRVRCFVYFKNADRIQNLKVMNYQKMVPAQKLEERVWNSGHRIGCPVREISNAGCECFLIHKANQAKKKADAEIEKVSVSTRG